MSDVHSTQPTQDATLGGLNQIAPIPLEQKEIEKIASSINIQDSQTVIQYGVGVQTKISDFSDTLLHGIRGKDAGHVGTSLSDLMLKIKEVDAGSLSQKPGMFGKLFGGIKAQVLKVMSRYEKVSVQIDRIVDSLDKARMDLLKDITMLDKLYEKNLEHLKDLDLYVAAGKLKLQEVKDQILPQVVKRAEESQDPLDAQKVQDLNNAINRFEKKLHDMQLTRMIAIQTAPQVRLIQQNNQILVEKIQSSILNTIPLWKNQIVIAVSLFRQSEALKLQREVTDMTNQMLAKNSELLKQGSIETAKESERGIVEIETLQKVNDDLISTIEETLKIQAEGREKRAAAEKELQTMEDQLKQRLQTIS